MAVVCRGKEGLVAAQTKPVALSHVFGADKSSLWLARDPTEASGAKLGVVFNSVWSMPEGLSWWDAKHKVA